MNILAELKALIANLSLEGIKEHFGVLMLMGWLGYLCFIRKWYLAVFTIICIYGIYFVRVSSVFEGEIMTHMKVVVMAVIGLTLFVSYVYYLWIANED